MTQPRLALAHRLMDGGSLSAAEAAIADILAADPGDIEANVLRAELSLRRGDTETARDGFRKVSRTAGLSDRTAAVAHAGLGAACHGLGEAEDATLSFAMAIDRGAIDTRTWLGLAEVFFAMGEWQALSKLAEAARAVIGLDWVTGAAVTLLAAVAAYGRDDIDECRSELNHLSVAAHDPERLQQGLAAWRRLIEANFGARSMPEHRPLVATLSYRDYIEALLSFRDSRADLYTTSAENTLHLVGDSHSLAPAHTSVALDGRLYLGCDRIP